jgi:acetyl-CoA acyltransferase
MALASDLKAVAAQKAGTLDAEIVPVSVSQNRIGGRYALCTMCIGVGQGIAVVLERA